MYHCTAREVRSGTWVSLDQNQGVGKAVFLRVSTTTFAPGHNRRYDFVESDYLPKYIKLFCAGVYDLMK